MSNNSDEKKLTVVDQTTGEVVLVREENGREEVIPAEALEKILLPLRDATGLPVHLQILETLPFNDELKEDLVSAYLGLIPINFDDVVNSQLPVLGMIVYQHPAYNGMDGTYHPEGYYQVRILVELAGEVKCVTSSSTALGMNVCYVLKNRRWWLFDEPIVFRFSKDSKKRHHIQNMSYSLSSKLLKKGN